MEMVGKFVELLDRLEDISMEKLNQCVDCLEVMEYGLFEVSNYENKVDASSIQPFYTVTGMIKGLVDMLQNELIDIQADLTFICRDIERGVVHDSSAGQSDTGNSITDKGKEVTKVC